MSECGPGARVSPETLVRRDRIQSGLAGCVVLVEASTASGSMHAVRAARAQGRPVYAVLSGRGADDSAARELVAAGRANAVRGTADLRRAFVW